MADNTEIAEKLRELAFSFDGRSEENAKLLRDAADALDKAEDELDSLYRQISYDGSYE